MMRSTSTVSGIARRCLRVPGGAVRSASAAHRPVGALDLFMMHSHLPRSVLVRGKNEHDPGHSDDAPIVEKDNDSAPKPAAKEIKKNIIVDNIINIKDKPIKDDLKHKNNDGDDAKASDVADSAGSGIGSANSPGGSGNGNKNGNGDGKGNGDKGDSAPSRPEFSVSGTYPPLVAIPMKDRPPLPGSYLSINVSDPEVVKAFHNMEDTREPYFVMFHMKDPDAPNSDVITSPQSIHKVGVLCQLAGFKSTSDGMIVTAYPHERVYLELVITPDANGADPEASAKEAAVSCFTGLKVSSATVKAVRDEPYEKEDITISALVEAIKRTLNDPFVILPQSKELARFSDDPAKFADLVGSAVYGEKGRIQQILEAANIGDRLEIVLDLLKTELHAAKFKDLVWRNMNKKVEQQQWKILLREHVKELQGVVDGRTPKEKKANKLDERVAKLKMSEEALEAYNSEKAKLESGGEHSSEAAIIEKYMDWLTSIPWGIRSKDRFDLKKARQVLDNDHYGLKDVKQRILEFIASGRVSGKIEGKILCLAGPPGTGKTSIAKSIATSLNRKYVRIAVGGIQDVHEVKGHRRTYVGAIPGRIISALKQAQTMNPLMLIDEIDKLDLSRGGGPASAFLEILDPEQNNAFVDTFIDVKVDLSKVLFVCTANYLDNIPTPLRDRMEVIDVSGYTTNEKREIAKLHLIPDAAKRAGLDSSKVEIGPETILRVIEKYCRETGVRNLKRHITRIFSKAAMKLVEEVDLRQVQKDEPAEEDAKALTLIAKTESETAAAVTATTPVEAPDAPKPIVDSETPQSPLESPDADPRIVTRFDLEDFKTGNNSSEPVETKVEFIEDEPAMEIPDDIKLEVTPQNLKDYIGPEVYTRDRVFDSPPPGVATGLAYSSLGGGDALYIESILVNSIRTGNGSPGVRATGSLKDVMKESASIAYSFSKLYMNKKFPENRFFDAAEVHVHCPDGAVPKDGPSAGISFTSSLMSLALDEQVPPNIAMTGEITVTGRVLAVGGLKEKILGARRYGCDTIIFPKDIENELEEISDEVKQGVTFIPVSTYQEVFDTIFPTLDTARANKVWKEEFAAKEAKKQLQAK